MTHVVSSSCPVCDQMGSLLKTEAHDGLVYRVLRCGSCRSLYSNDHYAPVSPDYVSRTVRDISPEVVHCQGAHKSEAYQQLMTYFQVHNLPVKAVLDFGCGTGGFLQFARNKGISDLYGIDASTAQVEYARRSFPDVRACTSIQEYRRIGIRLPQLDLITLWDVIEHIRNPDEVLADIRDSCSPNTLVFLSTPNAEAEYLKYKTRVTLSSAHSFVPWEHVLYYSPKAIRVFLQGNGFEVLHIGATVCYKRRRGLFEAFRRLGFILSANTQWAPQLFVLFRRGEGPC